jgi:flagellar motor protein MotB
MIGLLFIFIIILMAFALSYKATQESSELERGKLVAQNTALTDSDHLRTEILEHVKDSLAKSGVTVKIDSNHGVLRLPESLLFDEGSAEFRPGGEEAMDKLGAVLAEVLPCFTAAPAKELKCPENHRGRLEAIFVEGHTDNTAISTAEFRDNWDLSAARAKNTYMMLLQEDKDEAKRSPSSKILEALRNANGQVLFSMSAYGEKRPVASNLTPEGRALNRRIDLRFIMTPPTLQHLEPSISASPVSRLLDHVAPAQRFTTH